MRRTVTIIIPTFNSSSTILETLRSVLAQEFNFWECIIVDDGSTDNTVGFIKTFILKDTRFKVFSRPVEKTKGPSACRNYGLLKAQSEYVIFLDSDDLLAKECLSQRIAFAAQHSDKDIWIFKMKMFTNQPNDQEAMFNTLPLPGQKEETFYMKEFYQGKFPFLVSCPLWRKQLLMCLKGFDENMYMLEDPDLHLRALKSGIQVKTAFNIGPDCYYRISNDKEREDKRKRYDVMAATSNYYFLNKHIEKDNIDVKYNFKRIFNLYIFSKKSLNYNNKMIALGVRNGLMTPKYIILSYLILFYGFIRADKIKGMGYHSMRNKFNKL
jgi:glycosyltransferase involved in cell wall biosynthesis